MIERLWIAFAALSGAAAVAADAAARHLLGGDASRPDLAAIGARYGLIHAMSLLGVAILSSGAKGRWRRRWLGVAGWCFAGGLLLFPGSLYALAGGAPAAMARLAPWGGTLFIVGWLALLAAALLPEPAE